MLICNNILVVALMKFLIKYAMYEIDNTNVQQMKRGF